MLTAEEFRLFQFLIHEESGMHLKEDRTDFLENRIYRRMAATRAPSPYRYYRYVTENRKSELLFLLDLLTVNETSFFRNRPQIELFRNVVLPEIIHHRGARSGLRLWSAGCSTGEEPYTLAMVIRAAFPFLAEGEVRIYASDLSITALEAASRGVYHSGKVAGVVEDRYLRFFERTGDHYRVAEQIRKMVVFDFHNLRNDNGLTNLDAIFCRNVMIYFDEAGQKSLVEKFYRSLRPGGYLFLGHAETLQGMGMPFQFVYDNKGSAYRRPDGEEELE